MALSFNEPSAQAAFQDGKLTLQYFDISFNAGEWPNNVNGNLRILPEDGVSLTSTVDDVQVVAKAKIQPLIADSVDEQ